MKEAITIALLCLALSLASCSGPSLSAVGESDDLVIVVDDELYGSIGQLARQALTAEREWMLGEPAYSVLVTTPGNFGDLRSRRHILLLGVWDEGRVADLVRKNLAGVPVSGPLEPHIATDVWATRQMVATLMGDSPDELADYIEQSGDELLETLIVAARERLVEGLREDAANAGVSAMLEKRYGWSLSLPSGYEFDSGAAKEGLVIFGRRRPDRFVFVRWTDDAHEKEITRDSLIAARNAVCRAYHNGDMVELRRPVLTDTVSFAGRDALRLSGWWGNMDLGGGGPFRTYAFHDSDDQRTYIVDVSLFAPGLDKTSVMRNLDAIANTFR